MNKPKIITPFNSSFEGRWGREVNNIRL